MTTIAWDGHTLAGDRAADHGGMCVRVEKVVRLNDGGLFGASGWHEDARQVADWMNGQRDKPVLERDSFSALYIDPKGHAFYLGSRLEKTPIHESFRAIGTGRDFATAAMHLGKTAMEAVELAALFDTSTGLGVDSMTLDRKS